MQRMRRGAYAIILDFKKWSHLRWAGQLVEEGRVVIHDKIAPIHDTLVRVMQELTWRKSFDLKDEARLAELPTLDVYVEEINTLMGMLVDYWKEYVAGEKAAARIALSRARAAEDEDAVAEALEMQAAAMALPATSPAIQALRYGVNLGREFRIHFHFIGQSMSAKAAGGRDTRESFRTRLLARLDAKTWKMLADGIPFVACPSTEPGIWAHVHAGTYEIVRVPKVEDAYAVEYVRAGVRPSLPMFHGDAMPSAGQIDGRNGRELTSAMSLSDVLSVLPSRRDGSSMSLKALQRAYERRLDNGFPEPVQVGGAGKPNLFDPEQVLAWFEERERLVLEDR